MKHFFIGLLICYSCLLNAQNNAIQTALKNFDYETVLKLLSKEKETPETAVLKARCYKNIARYQDAILILERVVKQDVSTLSTITELAENYQLTGNFSKAKTYYLMALQSAPANRFVLLNYLNINYKLKDWNQTIALAHAILQKDTLPALFPMLGDCYAQLSKQDSAICYYQKAINFNPGDFNSLANLSGLYLHSDKYPELIRCTNRFISTDSSNQVINRYNGIGYCMSKNYDQAIYRLNKLFLQGDSSFLTNYYLGASYFAIKDYINAYNQLNISFQKDSSNINLYFYLGKSAIFSGHQKKGIQVLNNGLSKMIPNDSVVFNYYYNISRAYNRLSNSAEEIKYLKICYKYNPGYKSALYTIGQIYDTTIKNPEEALNYYLQFMATRPVSKPDTPKNPQVASYYNAVESRISELKAELDSRKNKK